ncbi:MAG: hypothetical protein GY787_06455 [Alteromonadales bacterium]|nr:hypothetical protein [Chloroflexota bacterium]MCP4321481.1 hypothetical protein [Alteromonadales bacterium]
MSAQLRDAISILPAEDLDRLSQGATAEECAEALSDYAIKLESERNTYKANLDRIEKYINSYDSGKGSAWDLECGLVEILREEV